MVFYFTSSVVSPEAFIYVGKDKVESECMRPYYRNCTDENQMRISSNTALRRTSGFTSTNCQVHIYIYG
jgi:hypothetical protein